MGDMVDKIKELYNENLGYMIAAMLILSLVISLRITCMYILSAGDPEKRKKANDSLKYLILGWFVGFALITLLPTLVGMLQTWSQG